MTDNDYAVAYAHRVLSESEIALREIVLAGSLDSARRTAEEALSRVRAQRASLVALSALLGSAR